MMRFLPFAMTFAGLAAAQPVSAQDLETCNAWATSAEAWPEIEGIIRSNYAYQGRVSDIDALFERASATSKTVQDFRELRDLAESFGYAFRDGHFHARPSPQGDRAWIPSGTDVWASIDAEGQVILTDVKARSDAAAKGLRSGMVITHFGGTPPLELAKAAVEGILPNPTDLQLTYAVNVVLSGRLDEDRPIRLETRDSVLNVTLVPGNSSATRPRDLISTETHGKFVHLRFNNSMGNTDVIAAFDALMAQHASADGLIIDLRDTPGGGETSQLRAVLGHFLEEKAVYQRHRNFYGSEILGVERQADEFAFPRGTMFSKPVAVLAGRWTGSIGEALAMAFDTTTHAHSIGTPLADLLGTLNKGMATENGCLGFEFAWEALFSNAGMPRENWEPKQILPVNEAEGGADPAIVAALLYLEHQSRK